MKEQATILSINSSDSTGRAGIQSDIRTIRDLGANATSVVTALTTLDSQGTTCISHLSTKMIVGQLRMAYQDARPQAIKVGMVNDTETIRLIRQEILGCPNIVCSPVILASNGKRLISSRAIDALVHYIFPETRLLILKCCDAEQILGIRIQTDNDMLTAAEQLHKMGAEWVMLRGGEVIAGRLTALLHGRGTQEFFSSYNIDGWQRHGISGASSAAITTCLALGNDVPAAIHNAHEYLHSQVVYSVEAEGYGVRPQELYNKLLSLIAQHHRHNHDVAHYANLLAITPRYLSQVTKMVVGKSPKQIINEYLLQESKKLLHNTPLSVQEIADNLGFSSPILFARFVRQLSGQTPREMRG